MRFKAFRAPFYLLLAILSSNAIGQQPNLKSESYIESLCKANQMPFVKIADGHYAAVVTTDSGESDRFQIFLGNVGNDANDEALQVMQIVFYLAEIPKGTSAPIALIKQLNEWNAAMSRGSVFVVGQSVVYQSSDWLFKSDAGSLAVEALIGHYSAANFEKKLSLT